MEDAFTIDFIIFIFKVFIKNYGIRLTVAAKKVKI